METEATTAAGPVPAVLGGAEADEVFGSRPATGRPHSMSLHSSSAIAPHPGAAGVAEVLIGLGVGAAIMYYLDPRAGAQRRARVRDAIVQVATLAPDTFESAAQDAGAAMRRLTADVRARTGRDVTHPLEADASVRRLAGNPIVATALGTALALVATRRRDALGAAVALVASTLLARGIGGTTARRELSISEEALEPRGGELRDPL